MGKTKKVKSMAVNETMCATCPFREGSPYQYLLHDLKHSALTQSSRICHSTGSNNAINRRTGKPAALCRGARDAQLQMFHKMGFLSEPTDAAWTEKCNEMGIEQDRRR
jgi:hypothetical protein